MPAIADECSQDSQAELILGLGAMHPVPRPCRSIQAPSSRTEIALQHVVLMGRGRTKAAQWRAVTSPTASGSSGGLGSGHRECAAATRLAASGPLCLPSTSAPAANARSADLHGLAGGFGAMYTCRPVCLSLLLRLGAAANASLCSCQGGC